MAGKNIQEILENINNMDIYQKDYDIIKNLLDMGDDKFFTKILEEVIEGNLYWSDFEHFLANTAYPELLEKNLESQQKIAEKLQQLINLRQRIDINYEYDSANPDETLVLIDNYSERPDAVAMKNLYDSELTRMRGDLLFELTRANSEDTIITRAYKTQLYNAIKNGELVNKVLENPNNYISKYGNIVSQNDTKLEFEKLSINETEITYGDVFYNEVITPNNEDIWCYYEKKYDHVGSGGTHIRRTDYTENGIQYYYEEATQPNTGYYVDSREYIITDDLKINPNKTYYTASQKKYEYINPDDIFFYITKALIPIDAELQTINEFDKIYMGQNNIDESTMKQIKMASLLLKKKAALNLITGEEDI